MSKSDAEEKEKEIGGVVWYSVTQLPTKNHDAICRLLSNLMPYTGRR